MATSSNPGRWFSRAAFVGIGVLIGSSAAIASAAGAGLVTSCVTNGPGEGHRGEIRIIDQGDTCDKKETLLAWNVQGIKGDTGSQGLAGPTGVAGPQGPVGVNGATGPLGSVGADGAMGPQGPVGANGAMGPLGSVGADGAMGPQGPVGADGAMGPQGPVGADGAMGPQGPVGADGAMGPQGPQGVQGPAGPPSTASLGGTIEMSWTLPFRGWAQCPTGYVISGFHRRAFPNTIDAIDYVHCRKLVAGLFSD